MSNLNWETAPTDATHGGNSPYERGVVTWFKDVGHGNHSFLNDGSMQSWHKGSGNLREWSLVERPKQWSGPQDGLPPVGTVCEYSLGDSNCWYACEIKYVLRDGDGLVAECHLKPSIEQYLNTHSSGECVAKFRALKTSEQITAEQRETAIREIMDIADVDCRVTAARLVDAGFKREVV
jgi:hypothetical protein